MKRCAGKCFPQDQLFKNPDTEEFLSVIFVFKFLQYEMENVWHKISFSASLLGNVNLTVDTTAL